MKHVLVATSATFLLALAGAAQALPIKESVATGGSFAATESSVEVSGNAQQISARQSSSGSQDDAAADIESAPINPYALAAAGLMAVAFLARHRPTRD